MTIARVCARRTVGIRWPIIIATVNASAFAKVKATPPEPKLQIDRKTLRPYEDDEPDVTTIN